MRVRIVLELAAVAALVALAVFVGRNARPFIASREPNTLAIRHDSARQRYEGIRVELVVGWIALESRPLWSLPSGSPKPDVRLAMIVGVVACLGYHARRLATSAPLRTAAALCLASVLAMAWEAIDHRLGHGRNWHEVLLVASPVPSYRDGYSTPLSLADVYGSASVGALLLDLGLAHRRRRG